MSNTITPGSLVLDRRVTDRISAVGQYVDAMRAERVGWGTDAQRDVDATVTSFFTALRTLFSATEVWIDGGSGYSFGGNMHGIYFGMIARVERGHITDVDGERVEFEFPPISWSFHS